MGGRSLVLIGATESFLRPFLILFASFAAIG
jgi:hypothetical protein